MIKTNLAFTSLIDIPGAPGAYNPSIALISRGLYLLAYRINLSPQNESGLDFIEVCFLDERFNVCYRSHRLDLGSSCCEDPRLASVSDQIFLVYGCSATTDSTWKERGIGLAELLVDEKNRSVHIAHNQQIFMGTASQSCEKNWTPFSYQETLYLSYSICPHVILQRKSGSVWEVAYQTSRKILWPSSYISGGTPACILPDGSQYLSFFHSVSYPFDWLRDSELKEERILSHTRYYTFGAYTFSAQPPFEILSASSSPIWYESIFEQKNHRVNRDERVIFPSGLIIDQSTIRVFLGENDSCIKMTCFELNELLASLVPVSESPCQSVHNRPIPCEI